MTIGSIIDQLYEIRSKRQTLAEEDKKLKDAYADLETQLIAAMDAQDTIKSTGKRATAIVTESLVPNVKNWDEVWDYIREANAFHLVQRRLNSAPWRELHSLGDTIPGTEPFTKREINLRKV
jgi:hypothetical protein